MALYAFNWQASFTTQSDIDPQIGARAFGDGYTQLQRVGINTMGEQWSMFFDLVDNACADAIEGFLNARGDVDAFYWKTPGARVSLFTCPSFYRINSTPGRSQIYATFSECFDEDSGLFIDCIVANRLALVGA